MRMWMVDPKLLCTKHLLGEHGEIHKHRHNFIKNHSIKGRIIPIVLIEPANMKKRHDELGKEILRRGFNHNSPYSLPNLDMYPKELIYAKVDKELSITELIKRCPECEKRIKTYKN